LISGSRFGFGLTDTEKKDLVAFLKALTGPEPSVNAPKLP
jgi:hypothetical protein